LGSLLLFSAIFDIVENCGPKTLTIVAAIVADFSLKPYLVIAMLFVGHPIWRFSGC